MPMLIINTQKEIIMEWKEMIPDCYERVLQILEKALDGLSQDNLNQQPNPDSNSMGWLTWHLTRVHDHHMAGLIGEEQLWIKDGWHAKFNRPADPDDTGFRQSSEEVSAFKSPGVELQLEYNRAVLERSKRYIASLSTGDLDRELNEPWFQPLPTVGVRLVSIASDNLQHAGQVSYLRGLLKGKGWSSI